MVETIRFIRGNLPHWLVADRPYFVTLRVRGTLPRQVIEELAVERAALEKARCRDAQTWEEMRRRQFARIETILDTCQNGRNWLTQGNVPHVLLEGLDWIEKQAGWAVYAAVVMSSHVHLVTRSTNGRNGELLSDLEKFKRFTGREPNRLLKRRGPFWAKEDFDHWCRTPEKVQGAVQYVRNNPVKAGLAKQWQDWPWTVVKWP
jgi:REP element-mobilizing transposase RayT